MTGPSSLPTGPDVAEPEQTPFALWQQAAGDRDKYLALMEQHGHLIPGKRPSGENIFGHPQEIPEWIDLAADIRAVDGNHDLGAGALAAALTARGWTRSTAPAGDAALLWKALLLRDWLEWALTDPRPERQHGLRQAAAVLASTASLATSATSADAIEDALDAAAVEHEFVPYSAQNNLTCRVCHRYRDIDRHGLAAPAGDTGLREALEPFAAFADPRGTVPTDFAITQGSRMAKRQLTMGDCYRAVAALAANPPTARVCPDCFHGLPRHTSGGMCMGEEPNGSECYCVRFPDPEAWGIDWAARVAARLPVATASTGPTGLDAATLAAAMDRVVADRIAVEGTHAALGLTGAWAPEVAAAYLRLRPIPPAQLETGE